MQKRFRVRLDELLQDAEVDPAVLRGMLPRLDRFLEPFAAALTATQRTHAHHYVAGLVSDLERKGQRHRGYGEWLRRRYMLVGPGGASRMHLLPCVATDSDWRVKPESPKSPREGASAARGRPAGHG